MATPNVTTVNPVVNQQPTNGQAKKPTYAELMATAERLEKELAAAKSAPKQEQRLTIKRSEKGGVSVYGLGRWPVTLYMTQWLALLSIAPAIAEFIEANKATLATKE